CKRPPSIATAEARTEPARLQGRPRQSRRGARETLYLANHPVRALTHHAPDTPVRAGIYVNLRAAWRPSACWRATCSNALERTHEPTSQHLRARVHTGQ